MDVFLKLSPFVVAPRQLIAFKGSAKAIKLFAKHIKVLKSDVPPALQSSFVYGYFQAVYIFPAQIEEQVKQLQKGVTHIGVGTPGRISALLDRGTASGTLIRFSNKSVIAAHY